MTATEVWVTGYGAITAAGPTSRHLAEAVRLGQSAVRPLSDLGGVPGARFDGVPRGPMGHRLERTGRLFVAAAEEAWQQSGLDEASLQPERVGLIEGSALGPLAAVLEACKAEMNGLRAPRPLDVLRMMPGAGGATFAQARGIRGPVLHISAGSVSAACAIGEACEKIAAGTLDAAVAGGSECPLEASIVQRFILAGLVQAIPGTIGCRPFDRARRGTVLGEGAGVLILESRQHAVRRKAFPRAVIIGYGMASEAHSQVAPDPSGACVLQATRQALQGNGDPGWIKAHATGTRSGDLAEYCGLASVFGPRLSAIPVTSLKPMLGHCLGASGSVEAVVAVLALDGGVVPATLGTTDIDPTFSLYSVVLEAYACAHASVLLLAQSFGGRCVALLVRAPSPGERAHQADRSMAN